MKIWKPKNKFLLIIIKFLKLKEYSHIWGLNPSSKVLNKSTYDSWNSYISKKPMEKISYIDLENRFFKETKDIRDHYIDTLEKEYEININKLSVKLIQKKINYLKDVFKYEKDRQDRIDNKFMQIIGQSSLLIAAVTLLLTLTSDKIQFSKDSIHILIIFALITLFFIILITKSLYLAIKNLSPTGYKKPPYTSVLIKSSNISYDFLISEFKTLYNSIEKNIQVNSEKADKVEESYKLFRSSIILFIIISFGLAIYIQISPKDSDYRIEITNQLDLSEFKQVLNEINIDLDSLKTHTELSTISTQISLINDKVNILETHLTEKQFTITNEIKKDILKLNKSLEEIEVKTTFMNNNN